MSTMLEEALSLVGQGWAVFPVHGIRDGRCTCGNRGCEHPGKHPRTRSGHLDATTDRETVHQWWARWPDSNIGGATGTSSGRVVLDVDAPDGEETLDVLEGTHGRLPVTPVSLTGGGGQHIVFRHPGRRVKSVNGKLGHGLDLKADGGYVVLPPSVHHSGRPYAWNVEAHPEDIALADLPDWIERAASGSPKRSSRRVASPLPETIEDGRRNDLLASLAGSMRRRGATQEAIEAALLAENSQRCAPPVSEEEVKRISRSIARYPPALRGASKRVATEDHAERPTIRVREELAPVVDEALAAVAQDPSCELYVRGGVLVHVVREAGSAPVLGVVDKARLRELLDRSADWRRRVREKETGEWIDVAALPPAWVAETILSQGAWPFPALDGVVDTPTMRADGSILDKPGYDDKTRLIYEPTIEFPAIPITPSQDQAVRAVDQLSEVFCDFPFVARSDRAAAMAAMLTLVARAAIRGPVPLTAFRSPAPGSGKGLCTDVVCTIGVGRPAPKLAAPKDEEEWRKLVIALAIEGARAVVIDNVVGAIGSAALASVLTTSQITGRILGVSRTATVTVHAEWFATGNNIRFIGDLGRRVIPCDIDAGCEHPEDRDDFKHRELLHYVQQARPQLVAAALTILRSYHIAGRPSHGLSLKGSFEAWDRLIRGALIWAGADDPCEGCERLRADSDGDLDALRVGLAVWESLGGSMTTAEATHQAMRPGNEEILSGLCELARCDAAKLDPRRLAYALRRVKGRICDGRMFDQKGEERTGARLWCVRTPERTVS